METAAHRPLIVEAGNYWAELFKHTETGAVWKFFKAAEDGYEFLGVSHEKADMGTWEMLTTATRLDLD